MGEPKKTTKKERIDIYKTQRVGVFVDVQNMYYSAKNLYNKKVNFGNILTEAIRGRQLIRAITYVIKADVGDEKIFFEALSKQGYEVKAKDLQVFAGGSKKGDWDIGLAMDAIELAPKIDVVVIVSGDGDYTDLIEHLKRAMGCRVEVLAFGQSASSQLRVVSHQFTDMDHDKRRFLI